MVVTPEFVWLHLPRTAGTSTTELMRKAQRSLPRSRRADWVVDDDRLRDKHDNLASREIRTGTARWPARVAMTFRPLEGWLLSNWKWAAKHGLHVPKERYLEGEFFSMRTGRWCPADWWLEYFEVSHVTDWIRMDCLESDLNDLLQSVDPSLPRIALPHLNELGVTEPAQLRPEAYEANPQWTALEARLWPDLSNR